MPTTIVTGMEIWRFCVYIDSNRSCHGPAWQVAL